MEGEKPLTDWEAYHFELLNLFPGCSTFEADKYGDLEIQYVSKALEAGRRLKYENLHWQSMMPAHRMAQAYNLKIDKNTPPATYEDFLIFKKLAYPEKEVKFSEQTIATVHAIAKIPHPFWIHQALPWGQVLSAKTKADPAEQLMLCSENMVLIAPQYNQGWVRCELAAFSIGKEKAGQIITLYNPENNQPVIDLRLRHDIGQGYYQDEQFKVMKFHEAELTYA